MNQKKLSITQKRLRDLSPRATQAVERHKAHFGVAASAVTLVPAAEAYIKVYDEAARHRSDRNALLMLGRQSLGELQLHLRSTLAILNNLLPSFDTRELQGTAETPERLLSDVAKVLEVLSTKPLPQAEALVTALKSAFDKARADWDRAQVARVELQQTGAKVREHALGVNRELVALRRLLRVVVGTSHVDYQALRASRISRIEEIDEDDTVVEEESLEAPARDAAVSSGVAHTVAIAQEVSA